MRWAKPAVVAFTPKTYRQPALIAPTISGLNTTGAQEVRGRSFMDKLLNSDSTATHSSVSKAGIPAAVLTETVEELAHDVSIAEGGLLYGENLVFHEVADAGNGSFGVCPPSSVMRISARS
jgi:hypothetical protein